MINILLISVDDKNSIVVSKIAAGAGFAIKLEKILDTESSGFREAGIILLDMTGIDEKDLKEGAPLYKLNRKQAFPAKVIIGIIRPEQIDFAAENTPDLDDIIFPDRLKKELLPRIVFSLTKSNAALPDNSIIVNKLILNLDKYELIVNGKVVELTFKEFELLKILMQNSNRVFTRINLLSSVWGYDFYGGSRTVDVHMRRLRAKIPPPYNDMLKTIRNVGYMFSPENE